MLAVTRGRQRRQPDPKRDSNRHIHTHQRNLEYDAETGFYYFRARYYEPAARRFISEDPIGYAGAANLYAYVDGDVMEARDPSGLLKDVAHFGAAGPDNWWDPNAWLNFVSNGGHGLRELTSWLNSGFAAAADLGESSTHSTVVTITRGDGTSTVITLPGSVTGCPGGRCPGGLSLDQYAAVLGSFKHMTARAATMVGSLLNEGQIRSGYSSAYVNGNKGADGWVSNAKPGTVYVNRNQVTSTYVGDVFSKTPQELAQILMHESYHVNQFRRHGITSSSSLSDAVGARGAYGAYWEDDADVFACANLVGGFDWQC